MPLSEGSPLAEPATKRPSRREILTAIGCAFLGFVVTAGALHAAIRNPLHLHADVRSEKLAMLSAWHGKIFSAAFGSSHVHNGFDPRVFDATLAGSPVATRSANLAVEGGSQSEQFVMAREFVKQLETPAQAGAPSQPCLVILELNAGANFFNDYLVHPRAINIYDWPTARLVTHLTGPEMTATQRGGRIGYALAAMGLHYANIGMLSNQIFAPPLNRKMLAEQTDDDRRGQMVMAPATWYRSTLDAVVATRPKQPRISLGETLAGNSEMVSGLAAASAVRNVSFIYVVMPSITDVAAAVDYPDHLTVAGPHGTIEVPIVDLGHPDRYPELFAPELWHDESHLDGAGAQIASRILATQLKKWYATHGGPPPCG
jgi:hypothetical protein